mmetsp:Transcript_24003/g.70742  ORF Transcript_24003/g.70742 Transcript_24003/m.70742 type:complete len:427 (+) Transcript_24003:259-1539(+)
MITERTSRGMGGHGAGGRQILVRRAQAELSAGPSRLVEHGDKEGVPLAPVAALQLRGGELDLADEALLGDDDEHGVVPVLHRVLQHGVDGDAVLGTDVAHIARDAHHVPVLDSDVEGRGVVVLEGEARHGLLGEGRRAGTLDDLQEVRDTRVGGGEAAGALADEHGLLEVGGLELHGIGGAVDAVELVGLGHEHWGHIRSQLVPVLAGDAEELDGAALHSRVLKVRGRHVRDALAGDVRLLHAEAEGELDQDLELGPRIEAAHVQRRVRLRVAQVARLLEAVRVGAPRGRHIREHVVGAAVDDARHGLDLVADEVPLQHVDDGDAAADGRLVAKVDGLVTLGVGIRVGGGDVREVGGDERLVGGDHALALCKGLEHHVLGEVCATHDLEHNLHRRVVEDVVHAGGELAAGGQLKVAGLAQVRHADL